MSDIIAIDGTGFFSDPENPALERYLLDQSHKDRPNVLMDRRPRRSAFQERQARARRVEEIRVDRVSRFDGRRTRKGGSSRCDAGAMIFTLVRALAYAITFVGVLNPMYIGVGFALAGAAEHVRKDYDAYREDVRRWLPRL